MDYDAIKARGANLLSETGNYVQKFKAEKEQLNVEEDVALLDYPTNYYHGYPPILIKIEDPELCRQTDIEITKIKALLRAVPLDQAAVIGEIGEVTRASRSASGSRPCRVSTR